MRCRTFVLLKQLLADLVLVVCQRSTFTHTEHTQEVEIIRLFVRLQQLDELVNLSIRDAVYNLRANSQPFFAQKLRQDLIVDLHP